MSAQATAKDIDSAELRKVRGAFFTPGLVARYVTEWAIRDAGDSVLEPSCGEAAFLLAAASRQQALGGLSDAQAPSVLEGVELHEASAAAARAALGSVGAVARVQVGDFFSLTPRPIHDAVIGNPPYVRYQDFAGESRIRSRAAALRAGVRLTNLASSWAAFTVHSALFLKPGGRLGLVLPAELLTVNYAAEVRQFLMARFARVRLVLFTERVFPGVLEEVVLVLADSKDQGSASHCELLQVNDAAELFQLDAHRVSTWTPTSTSARWSPALIPRSAVPIYSDLVSGDSFSTLQDWGDTTLGMVTGANSYFALSPDQVRQLGIDRGDFLPLSPPGSRHLRGLSFTSTQRAHLGENGSATWLFRPRGVPNGRASKYIRHGERDGVDQAYKCRVRKPWWRVPYLAPADLFLTYMNADTPRLTTNAAAAHHLNSVHGVYLNDETRALGRQLLPLASLNSATLLGAEVVGRAYGGGMLKIEPREADVLPLPSVAVVEAAGPALQAVRDRVTAQLRAGKLSAAVRIVDQVLLVNHLGVSPADVSELEQAHAMLTARRMARGANPRATALAR